MFTGIIQDFGLITHFDKGLYQIKTNLDLSNCNEGASISCNGVCLTATSIGQQVTFDVIPETIHRTTLGSLKPGDSVNVERALKFGDELGGHLLSGHIMGTAHISKVHDQDYTICCPPEMADYIQEKGYIAVDGISLTIGETDGNGGFDVHIIPETLRLTTLGNKAVGDRVNIEIDAMTQAVVETTKRMMEQREA